MQKNYYFRAFGQKYHTAFRFGYPDFGDLLYGTQDRSTISQEPIL